MTTKLDPRTAEKLREFARRRRRLILFRGVCAAVSVGVLAFGAVALIDYLILLPDWLRFSLSVLAYAATAVAVYLTCVRWLSHRQSMRELARVFEIATPDLHEDLLSAVELGDPKSDRGLDSEAFRMLLQADVAARIEKVKLEALLPRRLIQRWVRAAAVTAGLCLVLFAVPSLRFGKLMLRAAAPTANVERVSNIRIRVVEPNPPETLVPQGDTINVVAEVSDPEIDVAYLESVPADGKRTRIQMQKVRLQTFSTAIRIGRESLQYRIEAGTGQTSYYQLQALPRPQVTTFTKTYEFPAYSRLPRQIVQEHNGDLEALEGTEVTLSMETDQTVREAALRIETTSGRRIEQPLTITDGRTLNGVIKMTEPGTYRVRVVAARTGFVNKFSPEFEIRAIPDLLPAVTLAKPATDLAVPQDDVVEIQAAAKDDLGLQQLQLTYRLNGGDWSSIELPFQPFAKAADVTYRWDLSTLPLRPGDEVLMKMAATDLKGSIGTSTGIRLIVSAMGLDPRRLEELQAWQAVRAALVEIEQAAIKIDDQGATLEEMLVQGQDSIGRQQLVVKLVGELERAERLSDEAALRIQRALPSIHDPRSASDLVLTGRVLSRIHHTTFSIARGRVGQLQSELPLREDAQVARTCMKSGRELSGRLRLLFDRLLAGGEGRVARGDLERLALEQQTIGELCDDPDQDVERVARRQHVVNQNVGVVRNILSGLKTHADPGRGGGLDNLGKQLRDTLADVEKRLEAGPETVPGLFRGEYFADRELKKRRAKAAAWQLEFTWRGAPAKRMPADNWSARFTATARAPQEGRYTFYALSDDGVRLYINDQLVIDDWNGHPAQENRGTAELKASEAFSVRVEYFDATGVGQLRLQWEGPGLGRTHLVPLTRTRYNLKTTEAGLDRLAKEVVPVARQLDEDAAKARKELAKMLGQPAQELADAEAALKEAGRAATETDAARKLQEAAKRADAARETAKAKATAAAAVREEAQQAKQALAQLKQAAVQGKAVEAEVKQAAAKAEQAEQKAAAAEAQAREAQQEVVEAEQQVKDLQAPVAAESRAARQRADEQLQAATEQLRERAALEELRQNIDSKFVNDLAKSAAAVEAVRRAATQPEQQDEAAKTVNEIKKAMQTLEAGHELKMAAEEVTELAAAERWDKASAEKAAETSKNWQQFQEDVAKLQNETLKGANLPAEVAKNLDELTRSKAAQEINREMEQRAKTEAVKGDLTRPLEEIKNALTAENEKLQDQLAAARQTIEEQAPGLDEQLAGLAAEARKAQEASAKLEKELESGAKETGQQEARQLQEQQEELNDRLEEMRDALRRDANAQDLATDEGRERARDADDALAMLRQPPPKAEDLLRQAAAANAPEEQSKALAEAGRQQEKTADALEQLAEHYENVEAGTPEKTRPQLRAMEKELGIDRELNQQYAEAETLGQLNPEAINDRIKELENRLGQDETMQDELDNIAERTGEDAGQELAQIADQEDRIAEATKKLAEQQIAREQEMGKQLQNLAGKINALAQQEVPQIQKGSEEIKAPNQEALKKAQDLLTEAAREVPKTAAEAEAFKQQMDEVTNELKGAEEQLRAAEKQAAATQQTAQQAAQQAQQAAQKAQQTAQQAQQQAQQAQQQANAVKAQAEQAQQAEQQAQQTAQQTQEEAKKQAAAADQARQAADQARQAADQAKQAAAEGKATQEAAQQAQQQAEAAAQQAEQAKQAAQKAQEQAQAAQAQAAKQQQAQQQAAQQAQAAQQTAAQAQQQAQQQAQAAQQAQQAAQQAQQQVGPQGQQSPATQAAQAAQQAQQLSQQAQQLARQLAQEEHQRQQAMQQQAARQDDTQTAMAESAEDLERAARHLERLGETDAAAETKQVARQAQQTAQQQMAQAQQSLQQSPSAPTAQQPVQQAQQAARETAEAANALMPAPTEADEEDTPAATARPLTPPANATDEETSRWMARALDSLDQAQSAMQQAEQQAKQENQQGQPQQPDQQQASAQQQQAQQAMAQAQQAMAQAQQAQSRSMAQTRQQQNQSLSEGGGSHDQQPQKTEEVAEVKLVKDADWNKLPKQLARDLKDARREAVPEQYRGMVDSYFKVIAERSRKEE